MTLREFVLQQSTLPTGNTVRDHINNPGSGGGENIVVKDLEGTVIIPAILQGTILPVEITGKVTEAIDIEGIVDEVEVEGVIDEVDVGGIVNEC